MENHDEKTKRRNKDNEMRNMNNERGQLCPAASLTHCHTVAVLYWTFCRQQVSLLLKISLFNNVKLRCDFGRGRDVGFLDDNPNL